MVVAVGDTMCFRSMEGVRSEPEEEAGSDFLSPYVCAPQRKSLLSHLTT